MAVVAGEESGVGRSIEGVSSGHRCQSGEALAEWRSSEQVENGIASTSPPYWDTDDDDGGLKPSELFGKYTWKIEKFSQINKRELRSNAFEVGSYKWYILIYPQGCDVCNHLSLFLCVANHDKLLPGWSHFAQFTIAVVNKDPKKSKYSDTLHRFWKKEHDWGWKKFMELSKVLDGFIDADSLIIKAQVQVIRERADRPFRCLACNYRRELVRVYLTNVENICHRFVEERRNKLGKLIEDKVRWSSFRAFWLGLDENVRRRMSREKEDVILKVVVKHFFIEKDVTSTLVMDSLYSGLKALEGQIKCKKGRAKLLDAEETPAPIILVDQDTFLLVDDILLLLERASKEPLPPKDEKGPQNRTKDGNIGEENKDYIERDERRLTELGRRTVEIYVLAHIFSNKIEVAYQEAVALKRQEELIREEEAAWHAESELKARRGAFEKEKKTKKKQNKQKRNNRKGKDKAREERPDVAVQDKHQGNPSPEGKDSMLEELELVVVKPDVLEDISDLSDSVDGVGEVHQPDLEDRDGSPINWDTDASEVHPLTEACSSGISGLSCIQNGMNRCPSPMDDSSSTCSTDSVPSVVLSGHYRGNSFPSLKNLKSPSRGKNRRKAASNRNSWENDMDNQHSRPAVDAGDTDDASGRDKLGEPEMEVSDLSLQVRRKWSEQNVFKKEGALSPHKKLYQVDMERPSKDKTQTVASSTGSPPKNLPTKTVPPKSENHNTATLDFASVRKTSSNGVQHIDRAVHLLTSSSQISGVSKPETLRVVAPRMTEKAMAQQMSAMSRSSSAPLVPGPRPSAPVVSVVRTPTFLARSMSAAGRLGPEPSTATHSYVPQSYRNAIVGNHVASSVAGLTNANPPSSGVNLAPAYSQAPTLVSASMFLTDSSERTECSTRKSGFPFGMVTRDGVHNGSQWIDSSQREASRCMNYDPSTLFNNIQNLDLYNTLPIGSWDHLNSEYQTCSSGHRTEGFSAADELFPHLDIINELLDDEHVIGKEARVSSVFESLSHGPGLLNRHGQQFSYPNDPDLVSSIGSSNSSCRFDRRRSYLDDAFQRSYSSSGGHYESPREYVPHSNPVAFVNGQIDGLIPNQWQIPNSDLSLIGMRSVDCDGHPYYSPDYTNLTCGVNGYTVFRPSNGH